MTKEERRRQLLDTALAIVREEGTEALTLAHLAERAGVTKPIAYAHFGTRAGLLIALFRDYDDRATEAMRAALARSGNTLQDVVSILSATYIDTCLGMGPEVSAIFDALSASEETEDFRRSFREFLAGEFRKAFVPFLKLPGRAGTALLIGILGAAETLAAEGAAGRMSRGEAVAALTRVMLGALGAHETAPAKGSPTR
jgi:AcrR family transcriptional regulator